MKKLEALLNQEVSPDIYRFTSRAAAGNIHAEVTQNNARCVIVEGNRIHDKATFLKAFAATLRFPKTFGSNWDAFEDCMRDLSWLKLEEGATLVLLYEDAGRFINVNSADWAVAHIILTEVIACWQAHGLSLYILLRGVNADMAGVPAL
jgi:hypothetical protein